MTERSGKKQKLLVLASTYPRWADDHEPGFVHELSKRLVGHFEVSVVCPHAKGAKSSELLDGVFVNRFRYAPSSLESLVNDGGIVTNLKKNRWKYLLLPFFFIGSLWYTFSCIRRHKPDMVHAHWLVPQGLALLILKWAGVAVPPYVVTSHGADLFALRSRPLLWLKRKVVENAQKVTVVSEVMVKEIAALGVPEEKIIVQSMGVDLTKRFTLNPNSSFNEEFNVLFVGRLVEKKGADYLIQAVPAIVRAFPTVKVQIIGYGPQLASLQTMTRKLGVSDHVEFLGPRSQNEIADFNRAATVFVAPFVQAEGGDQEGLGLVLVEALGCGCPAVVTDVPAVQDVVRSASGISVVRQRSSAELANAVILALRNQESLRGQVASSRNKLVEKFDWASVADNYARILSAIE